MTIPPAHLEPYVRVLGPDLTIEFLLAFGGAELYLARSPQSRKRLVEVIGIDMARALGALSESVALPRRIPVGKEWVAKVLAARGLPVAEIARRLHTTDVTVRRYLRDEKPSRSPPDPRQLSML